MTAILHNRKTWFVSACYLLILAMCATCFTWARYVMTQQGDIYLPTVKSFTASLSLNESETETLSVSVEKLLPGVSDTKEMSFTINNWKTVTDDAGTETVVVSESNLEYVIDVYSAGNLPLDITMTDGEGNQYIGQRRLAVSDTLHEGYRYQFSAADDLGEATGVPAMFYLDGDGSNQSAETFTLQIRWSEDSETVTSDNGDKMSSHERYEKELETLEIRAVVAAGNDYETA